jgi:two-component system OmpR family sensor kinase
MSIFKKIALLFIISFILMSIIGLWIDKINTKRIDNIVKEKYVSFLEHVLSSENDSQKLIKIFESNKFKIKRNLHISLNEILFHKKYSFVEVSIYKISFDDELFIKLKFENDEYFLKTPDEENLRDKTVLNILICIDILVLLLIFFYIVKILSPIKNITKEITNFANGNLSARINIKKSNDEIGILANSFNQMATSLEKFIKTKEELLRDIGHELRTPIAKGKFAIEKIENESQKELFKKIFIDLETLTNELIELEKLELTKLNLTTFSAETLILEALSKLYLEDESKIELNINEDFKITADLYYLSIAIKNLIDNALKYTQELPIIVDINKNEIKISNKAKELSKDLEYYLKPFTQELSHRNGFGLGLSIVKKIIDKHQYKLSYEYIDGYIVFKIYLSKSL